MAEQLTDALIYVNRVQVAIVPGSARYSMGFGERVALAQSEGGGRVSQLMATNQSTAFSMVGFSLYVTPDNEAAVRGWVANRNRNAIQIVAKDDEGNRVTRSFTQALVQGDPVVPFSVDGRIEVEFRANQSV